MKSKNFEFLRERRSTLADLGAFAEKYANSDPSGSLIKQRALVENIVEIIYSDARLPAEYGANLFDLMTGDVFTEMMSTVVLDKLHLVRKRGNKAAHGESCSPGFAKDALSETYDIARWFHIAYNGGQPSDFQPYVEMASSLEEESEAQLARQNKALEAELARKEAQLQELLTDQAQARANAAATQVPDQYSLGIQRTQSDRVVNQLQFSEAETRARLVDDMLRDAGWKVGDAGASTEAVGQEVPLVGFRSSSGGGNADYVLWGDDGKPLAVIEAKKTAVSAEAGRTQAKLYADCLEKMHGQRPVIFYTNGWSTHLWDDAQNATPRKIYNMYAKDSLEYLIFQRTHREPLELVQPNPNIAGRPYQLEGIKRVTERFSDGHRKALIVQATGTGKTRVAISLSQVLLQAKWAKRILFLCDRRELRKQADNAYREFLPDEPRVFVTSKTNEDRKKRIYLATYPAMMKCFETFDVGFFDLVIADESHRSIYNKYRDLFKYFDALQVGLKATPTNFIDHNTYDLFKCSDGDPTFSYTLQEAINHDPPYLVPFRVVKVTTKFQRDGIKYSQLSEEEKRKLEEQVSEAEGFEYEPAAIDKQLFNKGTSRFIIRNLMENGITDASGSLPGKTIIFARNHNHAVHLAEIFDELYPKYGGKFCRVIDTYDKHAEQLIDDFKDPENELRIAISVDMLDTGIDIPEVVNLVFAKPVRSFVKFWQMIGRGTRLAPVPTRPSPSLFGPGEKKNEFLIFDHWANFDYFGEQYVEIDPPRTRSLMERLFVARVQLVRDALDTYEQDVADVAIKQLKGMLDAVKQSESVEVRDHWKELQELSNEEVLTAFHPSTEQKLHDVAPLMRWTDIRGHEHAYRFDLLATETQSAILTGGNVEDLRGAMLSEIDALSSNLNQVKAKADTIKQVRQPAFWSDIKANELEPIRLELRSVMKHKQKMTVVSQDPHTIDLTDGDERREEIVPRLDGQELIAYQHRVKAVLAAHFAENPILRKIRAGHAVSAEELDNLAKQILSIDPQVDIKKLPVHINIKGDLHRALRSIIGLDAEAVDRAFTNFAHTHNLTAKQQQFIRMLQNLIQANGGLEIDRLWEDPFTTLSADGIDGVFADDAAINELLEIIARFNLPEITTGANQ